MKLNWVERIYVNSPIRRAVQHFEVQWFSKKRPLAPGSIILEIGCGRGIGARLILEEFKPDRLMLSDLDSRQIRKAQAYWEDDKQAKINFCLSDATDLPFGNQHFDAVFGFGFLHHVPHWRDGLAEVLRVLKTGGAYYLVEFYPQLYQNVLTKHLLAHPEFDRFKSPDLHRAFQELNLHLSHTIELKNMGIIGIGEKM